MQILIIKNGIMNIKNIADLAKQLQSLGFEKMGYSLLKRTCFKPGNFSLSYKIEKENDRLNFQVHFEKDENEDSYLLIFYDVILQKGIVFPDNIINGINPVELAEQMDAIDWKMAFEIDENKRWSVEDTASWENERKIEAIIKNLTAIDTTQEGNAFALSLKLRYWTEAPFPELGGKIGSTKAKSEVSQRFYFFEGQPGISVDEAYRYLQNKWMEKSIQMKRKQDEEKDADKHENDEKSLPGNDLLKRRTSKRKLIRNKAVNK